MTDAEKQTIDRINTLIGASRSVWFGLMSFLAFISVTLMSIRDADLFLSERQTNLPVIGVEIPTLLFFGLAPLVAATFSAYVHVNLARLFTAIGDAPAQIDGKPLSEYLTPWLVADMPLRHRADGALRERPLIKLSMLVVRALTFWLTPILLLVFYWRSFGAHNELVTVLGCVLPLLIATIAARENAKHLDRTLSPKGHGNAFWQLPGRYAIFVIALSVFGWLRTEADFATYADTLDRGVDRVRMTFATNERFWELDEQAAEEDLARLESDPDPDAAFTGLERLLYPTDLSEVDFVNVPVGWMAYYEAFETFERDWCNKRKLTPAMCGKLARSPTEIDSTTRAEWCAQNDSQLRLDAVYLFDALPEEEVCNEYIGGLGFALLNEWRFHRERQRERLSRRNLSGRDLRFATLNEARLDGADLSDIRGNDALFIDTGMEGAKLTGAKLIRADFSSAQLQQADLGYADLRFAFLDITDLDSAVLTGTQLHGATMRYVNADATQFNGTWLQGATIVGTFFTKHTYFAPASLRGTAFYQVDLSLVQLDESGVIPGLAESFGDGSVRLPPGIPRPAHWPVEELGPDAYSEALIDFRGSIGQDFSIQYPPYVD